MHFGIRFVAKSTDLEHEWWVLWLENASAALAVVVFIFTTGAEAILQCVESTLAVWYRLKSLTGRPAERERPLPAAEQHPAQGRGKPPKRRGRT